MNNIRNQEQGEAELSPDQPRDIIKELSDALSACPPRGPYKASDPIPTDILSWSAQKGVSSLRQNSFFASLTSSESSSNQAEPSPDQPIDIIKELSDALSACPPQGPYKASDPIPTDILSWSA